jgi:flagellar protein FlaG
MRIDSTDASRLFERAAEKPPIPVNTSQRTSPGNPVDERALQEENRVPQVSEKIIIGAVEKANKAMVTANRALEFSVHEKTKEIIVKVVDTETKEVIREIPSEKILDMVANILEMAGILVDERR